VLSHTHLSAPFGGVLTLRNAELGEVVVPGTPVVTLADLYHGWVRAYINELQFGRVRLNQQVTVTDGRQRPQRPFPLWNFTLGYSAAGQRRTQRDGLF
jgi:HlyD family secretion protein